MRRAPSLLVRSLLPSSAPWLRRIAATNFNQSRSRSLRGMAASPCSFPSSPLPLPSPLFASGTAHNKRRNSNQRPTENEIKKLCNRGRLPEALQVFLQNRKGQVHDAVTLLKAFRQSNVPGKLDLAFQVYDHLLSQFGNGAVSLNKQQAFGVGQVVTSLMKMCVEMNHPARAVPLLDDLDRLHLPLDKFFFGYLTRASWMSNDVITAKKLIHRLQTLGSSRSFTPNAIDCNQLIMTLCKAPQDSSKLEEVEQVLSLMRQWKIPSDSHLQNTLIGIYSEHGKLEQARQLFDQMDHSSSKTLINWNTMLSAYTQQGQGKQALQLFDQMQQQGVKPDKLTFTILFTACADEADMQRGKALHGELLKNKTITPDVILQTALVNLYAKCGCLVEAQQIFDSMKQRNVASWTSLMLGYVEQGMGQKALQLFALMKSQGLKPDSASFIAALQACGSLVSLNLGKQIHEEVIKSGLLPNARVENTLIDMYGQCASVENAQKVFDQMPQRDIVSWTALMRAYGQSGDADKVLQLLEEMQRQGLTPNEITWTVVLFSCSHRGLIEQGLQIFNEMQKADSKVMLSEQVYNCVVDLYARAGRLDEAEQIINSMPMPANKVTWMTMLGACRLHRDTKRAERIGALLLEKYPQDAAIYVALGNTLASAGLWSEALQVRQIMEERRVKKTPGISWVEINGQVHRFMMDDQNHPEAEAVHGKWREIAERLASSGYIADTSWVLHDVEESRRKDLLCKHSEKMAISYGLLKTEKGEPLLVAKNLRMCGDCHNATKLISLVYKREIFVRDAKRFHHFKDGKCSCCDFY
jgi:pentatricopeptide repeat protein